MKIKVLGLALMLSMATVLGACEGGSDTPTNGGTTPAEPADGAATTPAPATTP